MTAGWVLVQTSSDVAPQVASELSRLPGVERVDRTAGAYDVVVRVEDAGALVPSAKRVARAAQRVTGVTLAVCCHNGPVDAQPPPDEQPTADEQTSPDRTIDLTEDAQPGLAQPTPARSGIGRRPGGVATL